MKEHKILRNITVIILYSIILFVFLWGCSYNANLNNVNPKIPNIALNSKLPLKVALYIPESTRNYSQPTDVSHGCIGMHVTGNFGQIFAGTVEGTLKQVFEELNVVKQPSAGNNDVLVEADMTEYIYKAGCAANRSSYGTVKGDIWALDRHGKEIWRSKETSKTLDFYESGSGTWQEFVPKSMASLIGTWAQELISQPQIKHFQKKTP
jgi:hypothetical protein